MRKLLGLIVLSSSTSVVAAVSSGSLNYASGFTTTRAWSSLTDFVPENINTSFTAWEDSGLVKFTLVLQVFGHFGSPLPGNPGLEENGTIKISSLVSEELNWGIDFDPPICFSWTAGGAGGWYTDVWMQTGGITGQDPHFLIADEEMGWIAGVYIHGEITPTQLIRYPLPEPGSLCLGLFLYPFVCRRRIL